MAEKGIHDSPISSQKEDDLLDPNNLPWSEQVDMQQAAAEAKKASEAKAVEPKADKQKAVEANADEANKAAEAQKALEAKKAEKKKAAAAAKKAKADLIAKEKAEEAARIRAKEDRVRKITAEKQEKERKLLQQREERRKKEEEEELLKRSRAISDTSGSRQRHSPSVESSDSISSDDTYVATTVVEDCESYAWRIHELLQTPIIKGFDYEAILSEKDAIDSCIEDLKNLSTKTDKDIIIRARNCRRDLLVKRSRLIKKFTPAVAPEPVPLLDLTSFQQKEEEQRLKQQAELEAKQLARAKEIGKSLTKTRTEIDNTYRQYKKLDQTITEIEKTIWQEFNLNILEFEMKYLQSTQEVPAGSPNLPPSEEDDVDLNPTSAQGSEIPHLVKASDGTVFLKLPKGKKIPVSILRTPLVPQQGKCIFCDKLHHSFLCCIVNTLDERKSFYEEHNLCIKCGFRHADDEEFCRHIPPGYCRWMDCMGKGHHPNLCPKAPYPITMGKCDAWMAVMKDYKAYLPEKIGQQGQGWRI